MMFVQGFRDVPEVRRWLRRLGMRSRGQGNADKSAEATLGGSSGASETPALYVSRLTRAEVSQ